MTTTPQGHVESLDLSDVIDAATAEQPGPFVTIHLPSDPTGATIDVVRRTFDAQLKDAAAQLSANGASDAEVAAILDPVREDVPTRSSGVSSPAASPCSARTVSTGSSGSRSS